VPLKSEVLMTWAFAIGATAANAVMPIELFKIFE
jgi:hypothetical protein